MLYTESHRPLLGICSMWPVCMVIVSFEGSVCVTVYVAVSPPFTVYFIFNMRLVLFGTKELVPLLRSTTTSSTSSGIPHTSAIGLARFSTSKS